MSNGFERKTYVEIVEDMQARAQELFGDNINLGDSSPLGMFIQTIAWELSVAWDKIEESYQSGFAYYATGNDLDKVASNAMRKRLEGTRAIANISFQGGYGVVVPKGFAVSTEDDLVFRTLEEIEITGSGDTVHAEADRVGEEYNVPPETITEIINPLPDVGMVTNPEAAEGGTDVESDDAFRERYLESMIPITGDNPAQYNVWAREVQGVGGTRVLPTEPSPGYVTVLIIDDKGRPADEDLVMEVKEHIDTQKPATTGVIVASVKAKDVSISVKVRTEGNIDDVKEEVERNVSAHFTGKALDTTYISYAKLGQAILNTDGVNDYSGLKVNGSVDNIRLESDEVPVLGVAEVLEWR